MAESAPEVIHSHQMGRASGAFEAAAAKQRIAELEAEVERLRDELHDIDNAIVLLCELRNMEPTP